MADLSLMTSFWLIALVLGAGASAFVLLPLFLQRGGFSQDREGINVGLYEERLSELESQFSEGELAENEFAQLRTELQQNLLADTGEERGNLVASTGIGVYDQAPSSQAQGSNRGTSLRPRTRSFPTPLASRRRSSPRPDPLRLC